MRLDPEKVRRARESLGYSIETTGEKGELSPNSVLRAEHGEEIRPSTARRLARALNAEVVDLYPKAEAPPRPSRDKAAETKLDELDIASLLQRNISLSEEMLSAREEGNQDRLDTLDDQLQRVIRAINKKGPFTETAASAKRRRRQEAQEEAGETTAEAG